MLFGTSSPRMRLPGGFFIRFRLHRWFLCFVPATRHCLCLFFLFFFFFPVFLAFLCILGLFFFSFRRLEFWVFMVGLGLGV